jgi:hypothetical protein
MGTKNHPGAFDCYANAAPDEPMFVLLGRDPHAAFLVYLWAELRTRAGSQDVAKIAEAVACADAMDRYAKSLGKGDRTLGGTAEARAMLLAEAELGPASRLRRRIIEHVEEELGYEDGEPSTERPGRWTFTAGAKALSELREWLLTGATLLCLALALVGCAANVVTPIGAPRAALAADAPIVVYLAPSDVPPGAVVLGGLDYSDVAFAQRKDLDHAIGIFKERARELGANAIVVDSHETLRTGIFNRGIAARGRALWVTP